MVIVIKTTKVNRGPLYRLSEEKPTKTKVSMEKKRKEKLVDKNNIYRSPNRYLLSMNHRNYPLNLK